MRGSHGRGRGRSTSTLSPPRERVVAKRPGEGALPVIPASSLEQPQKKIARRSPQSRHSKALSYSPASAITASPPFPWRHNGIASETPDPFRPRSVRRRRDGWTVERQVAFIEKLAGCGSIIAAWCEPADQGRGTPALTRVRVRARALARARMALPTLTTFASAAERRDLSSMNAYFFLLALLLLEVDLLELVLELEELFFDPLELPDLVGMGTLPSGALKQPSGKGGSGRFAVAPRSATRRRARRPCSLPVRCASRLSVPLLFHKNKSDT